MAGTNQVVLVRDGEARAAVIIPDEPAETARYAADELVWHVEKSTGVALEVLTESRAEGETGTRVYIGETERARSLGIVPEGREAYAMRSEGRDLFIAGGDGEGDPLLEDNPDVGTLFGVYEFLERFLGVRWLWPGELGTYVPRTDSIELPPVDEVNRPALKFRSLVWSRIRAIALGSKELDEEDAKLGFSPEGARRYGKALQVLLRRHRMGGMDAKPPTGHAFSGWWQRYGEEHPEWFALRRDKTRGNPDKEYPHVPMCVTNKELQDFVVDQWDGKSVLRLGPVDRPGRCNCERCRAWDGPQPETPPWFAEYLYGKDPRDQELFAGVTSDRYARFWKTIYEKAIKRNPDALVSASFLYENELPVPSKKIDLTGIYAEFVQWRVPYLRWFPMPEEAFEWIKEQWLGWRRTGIRMGYRPNYLHDGYVMPHFETRQSGEFFKFAFENGMEGARFDSLTGQWATQGLRLYTHLRLMSKPELEIEAIRMEYLSAFGPAAGTMDRYFEYWEKYAFDNMMRFVEIYRGVGWRFSNYIRGVHIAFPPECFKPAEDLLQRALAEANESNAEFADRVRFIQIGLEHAKLASRLAAAFDGEDGIPTERAEEARDTLRQLVNFRKEHEHTFFSDLYHVTSFWERNSMDLDSLMDTVDGE